MKYVNAALLILLFSLSCAAQSSYGSLSGSYEYLNAQGGDGQRTSLHCWYVLPERDLTKKFGVFVDFTGFYTTGENVHGYTGGPGYTFGKWGRVKLARFTEGGTITNAFTYVGGPGIPVKLNKMFHC